MNQKKIFAIIVLLIFVFGTLATLFYTLDWSSFSNSNQVENSLETSQAGFIVEEPNASVIARDFKFYTEDASEIVIAKVQSISDKYPLNNTLTQVQDVTIQVQEVLKGENDLETMQLTVFDYQNPAADSQLLNQDEEVLLFIGRTSEHKVVYANQNGKYLIENGRVSSAGGYQADLEQLKAEIKGYLQ